EPTSGVDPAARDRFWRLLIEMSRNEEVTIFISTHFMNEAERCDRISLMHAGRVLAVDSPERLRLGRGAATLEEAFIAYLSDASTPATTSPAQEDSVSPNQIDPVRAEEPLSPITAARRSLAASLRRTWAFARREAMEVLRDRIRLAFALLGPLVLLLTISYGI